MNLARWPFVTLQGRGDAHCIELRAWLAPYVHENAFNPSVQKHRDLWYMTFRHFGATRHPPFEASLLIGRMGAKPTCISLTKHAASFGIPIVADPKLLVLYGEVWATFNDGWSNGNNNIYLMSVTPSIGAPLQCTYSNRRRIEKNWAFFTSNDELKALYSVDPVHVLSASLPKGDNTEIAFVDTMEHVSPGFTRLTIGTQIARDDGKHYIVLHERWGVSRWRAYVGRWAQLYDLDTRPRIELSENRLCFSHRSMLGSLPKHNPHLMSCTYFSGLLVEGDTALLTYGINDIHSGISEVEIGKL